MIFILAENFCKLLKKKPVHRLKCLLNTVASVKIAVDFTFNRLYIIGYL